MAVGTRPHWVFLAACAGAAAVLHYRFVQPRAHVIEGRRRRTADAEAVGGDVARQVATQVGEERSLPAAFVDLDAFDENVDAMVAVIIGGRPGILSESPQLSPGAPQTETTAAFHEDDHRSMEPLVPAAGGTDGAGLPPTTAVEPEPQEVLPPPPLVVRVRIATKSMRTLALICRAMSRVPPGLLAGLMTFAPWETLRLASNHAVCDAIRQNLVGADPAVCQRHSHLLLPYPVADVPSATHVVQAHVELQQKAPAVLSDGRTAVPLGVGVMVDSAENAEWVLKAVLQHRSAGFNVPRFRVPLAVWIDIDMSFEVREGVRLGARRSGVRTADEAAHLARHVLRRASMLGLSPTDVIIGGIMGYESQMAGLEDFSQWESRPPKYYPPLPEEDEEEEEEKREKEDAVVDHLEGCATQPVPQVVPEGPQLSTEALEGGGGGDVSLPSHSSAGRTQRSALRTIPMLARRYTALFESYVLFAAGAARHSFVRNARAADSAVRAAIKQKTVHDGFARRAAASAAVRAVVMGESLALGQSIREASCDLFPDRPPASYEFSDDQHFPPVSQIASPHTAVASPRSPTATVYGASASPRTPMATAAPLVAGEVLYCNGGGSGSVITTTTDGSVTEVTIGSGGLCGHLFDRYLPGEAPAYRPALFFALRITRSVDGGRIVTCSGGGWVSSGPAAASRLPKPVYPPRARLLSLEGAGEVQTPLLLPSSDDDEEEAAQATSDPPPTSSPDGEQEDSGTAADMASPTRLSTATGASPQRRRRKKRSGEYGFGPGDVAVFRPAKSGELAEVFVSYILFQKEPDGSVAYRTVPTYRGDGIHAWSPASIMAS